MRKLTVLLCALLLCACADDATPPATTAPIPTTQTTVPATAPTEPETTAPTQPSHTELYIPGLSVEDVITYFNEVSLDAEFVNSGDPSLLQKWVVPICYYVHGTPTEQDLTVLSTFCAWLNEIPGFPGISRVTEMNSANLQIHFCTGDAFADILGQNFVGLDGGVTFWYDGENRIYNATICYRTDLDQYTRNSVIMEEIYNGLGPVQDTDLREDSLIYSGFSTPQEMAPVDELIIKLLYHPDIRCGMTAAECEAVIRRLYY